MAPTVNAGAEGRTDHGGVTLFQENLPGGFNNRLAAGRNYNLWKR